jgi:hypothetical protein
VSVTKADASASYKFVVKSAAFGTNQVITVHGTVPAGLAANDVITIAPVVSQDTITSSSGNTVVISGDLTARYVSGRRVTIASGSNSLVTDSNGAEPYYVVSSSYGGGNTTVTLNRAVAGNENNGFAKLCMVHDFPVNSVGYNPFPNGKTMTANDALVIVLTPFSKNTLVNPATVSELATATWYSGALNRKGGYQVQLTAGASVSAGWVNYYVMAPFLAPNTKITAVDITNKILTFDQPYCVI